MYGVVSVIVSVFNCESYVREAIDSLTQQTYSDIEILVCDDCSTDNTWTILSTYRDNRIQLFQNEVNKGVVYTRNFLLTKATGDYIVIQDGDDWSAPHRIETLLKTIASEDIDVCGSSHVRIDHAGNSKIVSHGNSQYVQLADCANLPFMPATIMLRKKVYNTLGGYHDFFSGAFAEDLYWIIRMAETCRIYYLNQPLYGYRFNPASLTNTVITKDKFVTLDLVKHLIQQRIEKHADWLEEGNYHEIKEFKTRLLNDKKWLSEQYRISAAVQCDGEKYGLAFRLGLCALLNNPVNYLTYRTALYIAKRWLLHWVK